MYTFLAKKQSKTAKFVHEQFFYSIKLHATKRELYEVAVGNITSFSSVDK